ncbi:A/G-specific DNA-adenine glycosylase [Magnetococcus marinus MC-1]|uniref:Adenine DNA glycosylase n=1 Tax=Magnetococcus marinus (strain ATCC BAA-1437 / JCM 17883 / MC-1) TaxID=156889 RepID=A0L468_MAGMM|nr:A/G-specific adenine glycosylase [Magnetococcus marinus]ABK42761.1 A/G-specific DNA-adenine glycosylase [Magnetococcus marinus MC-1]
MTLPHLPADLAQRLLAYYDEYGRDLPWRQQQDLYRIWLSEIMLQQTGVKTVMPYYEKFLSHFPSITQLAAASQEQVLAQWQGLGYYRRARMLHQAAQQVVQQHGGLFPEEITQVQALPGIGPSTAAAILAIGRNQAHTILDGNVMRVLARLLTLELPVDSTPGKQRLWQVARQLTSQQRPGDYAQAIMDLGATLCTRSQPACSRCPWGGACAARQHGSWAEYPKKREKKPKPHHYQCMWVLLDTQQRIFLRKRPLEGLLGGLWEPLGEPLLETPPLGNLVQRASHHLTALGIQGQPLLEAQPVDHIFTHFRLTVYPILVVAASGAPILNDANWWPLAQLDQRPIATLHRKVNENAVGLVELSLNG